MLETARFAILPSERKPRILVPLGGRAPAAKALQIYNAQTFRARAAKHCLEAGLRMGLAQPLLRFRSSMWISASLAPESWHDSLLNCHLSNELVRQNLVYAVSVGTPNASQKPVLQLMESNGRIAGYAKVGWNERTIALVRNESRMLQQLSGIHFSAATLPHVLQSGSWRGYYILTQSAHAATLGRSPALLDRRHLEFLIELQREQGSLQPLAFSRLTPEFSSKLDELNERGFHYYSHLIATGIATCGSILANSWVPCGLGHGDFAPWNILLAADKLLVIDWEYGSEAYPPLWDLFHFHISSATELRNRPASAIYLDICEPGPIRSMLIQYCTALGIPKTWIEALLIGYLCDALHKDLMLNGTVPSSKDQLVRATLGRLLAILCRPVLSSRGAEAA
jgi:hypothetical protein